jgi:putative transposase
MVPAPFCTAKGRAGSNPNKKYGPFFARAIPMPRKQIKLQSEYPYHVTNRLMDKQFFEVPIEDVWKACESYLIEIQILFAAKIHAFVLMNNHFHLVLTTPEVNLSDVMEYFQSRVARQISILRGCSSVRFQSRYRWSIVNTETYFLNLLAYVYLNPVRAGIVKHPHEYRYSSLHGQLGLNALKIPVCSSPIVSNHSLNDPTIQLTWLPLTIAAQMPEKITRGLRRAEFKIL